MTGYDYVDPRSIYSKESIKKMRTRTPKEVLEQIKREKEE